MTSVILELCPVEEAIQVIGGESKLLVLRSLLLNGPQRYNEMLQTVTGINQRELTRNLKELAGAGLIERLPKNRRAEPYELSELGKGLMPMFTKPLTW